MNKPLSEQILEFLADSPDGARKGAIRRSLRSQGSVDNEEFSHTFRDLAEQGRIVRKHRGFWIVAPRDATVTGVLSVNPRGFGFVAVDDEFEMQDVFIPPPHMFTALSGDRVRVTLLDEADERGPSGRVVDVLQRAHPEIAGVLYRDGEQAFVRPMRRDLPDKIELALPADPDHHPAEGSWVVARMVPSELPGEAPTAELARLVSSDNNLVADLDAVIIEFDLAEPYSPRECRAAKGLLPRPLPSREDLQEVTLVTIDPDDAKDFDDAVSFQPGPTPDTALVGVHIADVAAYVAPGSEFDQKAADRGFTSYLPGRTLPMLPHPLAATMCSLREGQPRNAHSVLMTVDRESGEVVSARRTRSRVCVTQRLTFNQVQHFIETGEIRRAAPAVRDMLDELIKISQLMRRYRKATEEFVEFENREVRVLACEDPPHVVGLVVEEPNEAHALVEEFMLAANSAVGAELRDREIPGIFRVHGEPKPRDVATFREWAGDVLEVKVPKLSSRSDVNRFLHRLKESHLSDVVANAFLRTLERAMYQNKPALHFGLGKECYSHFTSPIRRYTDLVVHQQLWAMDAEIAGEVRSAEECAAIAKKACALERNVDDAYYAATDRLKLRYLEQRRAEGDDLCFDSVVSRVVNGRVTVFLRELGMIAFLPFEPKGKRARDMPSCGDTVRVEIGRIDTVKSTLELRRIRS